MVHVFKLSVGQAWVKYIIVLDSKFHMIYRAYLVLEPLK